MGEKAGEPVIAPITAATGVVPGRVTTMGLRCARQDTYEGYGK